jgi:hypothetical protein
MRIAAAAARALERGGVAEDVELALETGMTVCYARPFTKGGVGKIDERKWAPTSPFNRHHRLLLDLRHEVYAHTDVTHRHLVEWGTAALGLRLEQTTRINPTLFPAIAEMCESQQVRFREEADRLAATLRLAP